MIDNVDVKWLKDKAYQLGCEELARAVLDDDRFDSWPASSVDGKHHHHTGGLTLHTREVAEFCLAAAETAERLYPLSFGYRETRHLFLAAVFHDAGKMWDYDFSKDRGWHAVQHRDEVGHVARSAILWNKAANEARWEQADIEEVLHCILAHHGYREWGSPVTPKSRMAWILHLCDMMSARINES